jgi:transcriptional regulator with XRE-family HTH domain
LSTIEKRGQKLKELREKRGWSLRLVAEKIDTSASFISDIENAKTNPSIKTLEKITEVYGLSLSQFFDMTEK